MIKSLVLLLLMMLRELASLFHLAIMQFPCHFCPLYPKKSPFCQLSKKRKTCTNSNSNKKRKRVLKISDEIYYHPFSKKQIG